MEFITTGNRIAVENFDIGKIYTITWETGNYKSLACTGKGTDFVMFQDQEPDLLFCLTMDSAISVASIDEGGGGSGTMNYNELENKPSINGFVLVGNKTGAELGLASQSDLEDYATNASVVAGLATKQDALSSSQLAAVNSGITSALVTQIGINTSAIAGKQDALSSSQLAAVNSGITSALVTQIGTNTSAIAEKQDALSNSQLAAVNSGITSADVAQITTNKNNISFIAQNTCQNLLELPSSGTELGGVLFTVNSDGSVAMSGTKTENRETYLLLQNVTFTTSKIPKKFVAFANAANVANDLYVIVIIPFVDSTPQTSIQVSGNMLVELPSNVTSMLVRAKYTGGINTTASGSIYPMICTPEMWAANPNFEIYAPTNAELYAMIKALQ